MRGLTHACLIEADDDCLYVAKFRNNPQQRRVLINELVASIFLHHLRLPAARPALVEVTTDFIANAYTDEADLPSAVQPGVHFGSLYAGTPHATTVFDFLPDSLLLERANVRDLWAVLPFDFWTANADRRQCVFYRPDSASGPGRCRLHTLLIDHGIVFGGSKWELHRAPSGGMYMRPCVYGGLASLDAVEAELEAIRDFPIDVVRWAVAQVPMAWFEGDRNAFTGVLEELMERRALVADLVGECLRNFSGYA